ncbi:hypothetical protein L6452_21897 [Arctium lappa]|uniref:Uncharacterized protein n=1 Tax=Arctium lappa TaxID=4217 RepID=A0ACB9AYB3_ARCLA|nr:hypothetical protein L6452_21897 [Arctium lappa]
MKTMTMVGTPYLESKTASKGREGEGREREDGKGLLANGEFLFQYHLPHTHARSLNPSLVNLRNPSSGHPPSVSPATLRDG